MDRYFDKELNNLKRKLSESAERVRSMIKKSIEALKKREEALTKDVFLLEDEVNMSQIDIDNEALKLIALRQPAASDLRLIVAIMKMNSELERMGDLAVNTAKRAIELMGEAPLKPLIDLPRMADISQKMLDDAISSFMNKDVNLARDVCTRDDEVDDLNDQIFRELITYMLQDPHNINRALKLILIARYLERIADHATNIAEDTYYMAKGKDIRHHIDNGKE